MPTCPAEGGVDIDLPEDQPGRISPRQQQRPRPGPHTPCHLRNIPYTACHVPYSNSRSRHGTPVRTRLRTPSTSRRQPGRLRCVPTAGSSDSSTGPCSSEDPPTPHLDHQHAGRAQEAEPRTRPGPTGRVCPPEVRRAHVAGCVSRKAGGRGVRPGLMWPDAATDAEPVAHPGVPCPCVLVRKTFVTFIRFNVLRPRHVPARNRCRRLRRGERGSTGLGAAPWPRPTAEPRVPREDV